MTVPPPWRRSSNRPTAVHRAVNLFLVLKGLINVGFRDLCPQTAYSLSIADVWFHRRVGCEMSIQIMPQYCIIWHSIGLLAYRQSCTAEYMDLHITSLM